MSDPTRVLLVEDDPMVVHVNQRYTEQVPGFRIVSTTDSGRRALTLAERLRPDLMLLDIYLPDLTGLEVLMEVRRRELPVDVILVTAAQDAKTVRESLWLGAVDYIIKPFSFERLRAALETYRTVVSRLQGAATMNQAEIDRLMSVRRSGAQTLPKGLADWTLRQVLQFLYKQQAPVSAAELGLGVGLSRVTARRYLEYLCAIGQVRQETQHGTVGRPALVYSALAIPPETAAGGGPHAR